MHQMKLFFSSPYRILASCQSLEKLSLISPNKEKIKKSSWMWDIKPCMIKQIRLLENIKLITGIIPSFTFQKIYVYLYFPSFFGKTRLNASTEDDSKTLFQLQG